MFRRPQKIAIGTPALPHPAANRLVQSTFLIGFAMRKVLSITSDLRYAVKQPLRNI
jgi:hypothetical protein